MDNIFILFCRSDDWIFSTAFIQVNWFFVIISDNLICPSDVTIWFPKIRHALKINEKKVFKTILHSFRRNFRLNKCSHHISIELTFGFETPSDLFFFQQYIEMIITIVKIEIADPRANPLWINMLVFYQFKEIILNKNKKQTFVKYRTWKPFVKFRRMTFVLISKETCITIFEISWSGQWNPFEKVSIYIFLALNIIFQDSTLNFYLKKYLKNLRHKISFLSSKLDISQFFLLSYDINSNLVNSTISNFPFRCRDSSASSSNKII